MQQLQQQRGTGHHITWSSPRKETTKPLYMTGALSRWQETKEAFFYTQALTVALNPTAKSTSESFLLASDVHRLGSQAPINP